MLYLTYPQRLVFLVARHRSPLPRVIDQEAQGRQGADEIQPQRPPYNPRARPRRDVPVWGTALCSTPFQQITHNMTHLTGRCLYRNIPYCCCTRCLCLCRCSRALRTSPHPLQLPISLYMSLFLAHQHLILHRFINHFNELLFPTINFMLLS